MTEPAPGLGHNQPPEETPPAAPLTIAEQLAASHKGLVDRYEELMALAKQAPAEVKDEETFKPLSDLLKAARAYLAMSEAARKIENEESRKRTATIDAWFKNPAAALTETMKAIKERTDAYLDDKKAAEEKRRKEEADRKAKAAAEKAEDALWAEARAELAVYDARKAEERELAARQRKEAEARRADHLKNRAKRLAQVEPYLQARADRRAKAEAAAAQARLQAIADERARLEAEGEERLRLEAEDQRRADEAARRAQELQKTKDDAEAARKSSQAARREETSAGKTADRLIEAADEHADQAEDLGSHAGRLQKRADKAQRQAEAGPADMSRTRSDLGTVASVSKSWKVISIDRNVVDLNLLRGFLHPDAVEVAVRGYMMAHRNDAGGPVLEGAVFEQVEEGVYR